MRFKKTLIFLILFMILSLSIYALPTGIKGNQVVLGTIVMNFTGIYNVSDLVVNGSLTVGVLDGPINWTAIQNFPAECPANSFVSTINDTITCTIPNDNDSAYYVIFLNQTLGITDAAANARFVNQSIMFAIVLNITDANAQYVNITGGTILGDLTVDKNVSFQNRYGEMFISDDVGLPVGLDTQNVWFNVTNFTCDLTQSIACTAGLKSELIVPVDGVYDASYSLSFNGGTNVEYDVAVAINNVMQNNTKSRRKIGASSDIGNIGDGGFLSLSANDVLTLQILNQDGSADANVFGATFMVIKIG